MSRILDLAKSFSEQSSKEAETLNKALQSDFTKLETAISSELNNGNERLRAVIQANNEALHREIVENQRRMSWAVFKPWAWLIVSLSVVLGLLMIWSALQGLTIYDQRQTIAEGRKTLTELPEGFQFVKEKGSTYIVQDKKNKAKPEVYQVKSGEWVVKLEGK